MLEAVTRKLREEPIQRLAASFDARVLAAIRWSERPSGLRAVRHWLMRPRRVLISPLGALAAAAVFAGIAYLGAAAAVRDLLRGARDSGAAATAEAGFDAVRPEMVQLVQFVLVAPEARSVSVVGDFNDWNDKATPLSSISGNVWTAQVPLRPGRYNYVFMVDGKTLVADPQAPKSPMDEFGQRNSIITVGGSRS